MLDMIAPMVAIPALLGFHISSWTADEIVAAALAHNGQGAGPVVLVVTTNTDHVTKLRHDKDFAMAYARADIIVCDGWPVAAYARLRGQTGLRITGYELAEKLMRRTIPPWQRMFFVVDSLETQYALDQWTKRAGMVGRVASWIPPMGFETSRTQCIEMVRAINEHGTTLLMMGVGAPRSEVFVSKYADMLPECWAFCVGQAIRVEVGLTTRAPPSLQRLHLEWAYRIALEPRRLLRRYIVSTAGFLLSVAADLRGRQHAQAGTPVAKIGFVVSMFGQRGGGMGRIVEYLLGATHGQLAGLRLVEVDTRGQGRAYLSLHHLASGLARICWSACLGRMALLHVNMAERGSIFRKAVMMLSVKPFGVPIVLHLHAAEIIPMYAGVSGWKRFLVRRVFLLADRIIVLGDVWRQWLESTIGVPPERIDVVYNGVPDFSGHVVARGATGPFRVLFLSNLHMRKGLGDLLPALAALNGWRLTVAGGGDATPFRALAEELGIGDRVTFLGWVDHVQAQRLLGDADTLVLPSYQEGLPLVILEALAASIPVITTPVGSIGEVLTHDETALLVQPGDQLGIAREIRRLIADPALHRRLALGSRALYLQEFALDRFTSRIGKVYDAALAANNVSNTTARFKC